MSVAYVVKQYPKVSHSFFRCRSVAFRPQGVRVQRRTVRGRDAEGADPLDRQRSRRPALYHLVYLAEVPWLAACRERTDAIHRHAHFGIDAARAAMRALEGLGLQAEIERLASGTAFNSFERSEPRRLIDRSQRQAAKLPRPFSQSSALATGSLR